MNQIATQDQVSKRSIIEVVDAVPLLDTSKFEHMQRIATGMARSTLIPDSLREEGTKNDKQELPFERVAANCFLIVNQAVRWGLDPFSVAQAVSVVHGKLCYEGKLVAAVIQAKLGFNLHHHFVGNGEDMRVYLSDKPLTDEIVATLNPGVRRHDMRLLDGSVSEWKTTGNGSPWAPKNFVRMLIYRGTRDWCRIYEPALMLGVYTPDEMLDMSENARSVRAKEVSTPSVMQRLQQRQTEPTASEGFDKDFVTTETETLASAPINEDQPVSDVATSKTSDSEGGDSSVNSSTLNSSDEAINDTVADEWVLNSVNMLIASAMIGGDLDVMRAQYRSIKQNAPSWVDKPTVGRIDTVSVFLVGVMDSNEEFDKERIAAMAKIDAALINDLPEVQS